MIPKKQTVFERKFMEKEFAQGNHCERVAGSGSGQNSVCDCVLFKDRKAHLVEVKATKEQVFYVRASIKEQLERMRAIAETHGCVPILAVRFKMRGWYECVVQKAMPNKIVWGEVHDIHRAGRREKEMPPMQNVV